MSYIVVDVEADWPCPWLYSMVSFWAVVVDEGLNRTFYAKVCPISENWIPEALAVSWHTREETLTFQSPEEAMDKFARWIQANSNGRPIFMADNLAFDWQFINYYFHNFYWSNPFGFSWHRINDLWAWMEGDVSKQTGYKKYTVTPHTHHPVDDAKKLAEGMLYMKQAWLRISLY